MKKERIGSVLLAALMVLGLCACSYIPKVTEVRTEAEMEVEVGQTAPIEASVLTEDQQEGFEAPAFHSVADPGVTLSYESGDAGIASVDASGVVTANAPGETTVTVTASGPESSASSTVKVICFAYMKDLAAVPEALEVEVGKEFDLAGLCDAYTRWNAVASSQDKGAVSIDGTVLKAQAPGDTAVTLTLGPETKEINVHTVQMVEEYQLDHETLEGSAGTTAVLGVGERKPETANGGLALTFTSSDENVVAVDPDGTVHLIAPGEATVTAVNELGMEAECKVTVTEAKAQASSSGTGAPVFFSVDENGNFVWYDLYGNRVNSESSGSTASSGSSGSASGSTNPADYDRSDKAVAAVLDMVGGNYKCSQVAEAAANARGKTGWKEITIGGQRGKILEPEGFLDIGTKVSEPSPGDILYYADGGAGFSHVGVYIGDGMAVHGNWDLNGKTVIASAYYTTLTYVIHI